MGRIKSKLIKRTAKQLVSTSPEMFESSFEENKKVLGNTLESKKTRNKIAGYITRIKKNTKSILQEG
jgi:small subunit ribosomal protein S17e